MIQKKPYLTTHKNKKQRTTTMPPNHHPQFLDTYLAGLESLHIAPESLQRMREEIKVRTLKSKENLILPGEICKHTYLVVQGGFVCRHVHGETGEAKTINFYLENLHPVMACVDSYFTQVPTQCELKSITQSTVMMMPKATVDALRAVDDHFAAFYHDVVITALVEENEVKTKLIACSSKEKYQFIVDEMPMVIQTVPSKYIAEFCGISPEWLSKLKKQG